MQAIIHVDKSGMVRIRGMEDRELEPTHAGDARNPITLGPECTFEFIQSKLLGQAIIVFDDQGNPLYGVSVKRPGMYVLDEHGHTYAEVEVPTREPALT